MVSIAEGNAGNGGANGAEGGVAGCQHYKRKCKFYVSIAPVRPRIMKVNMSPPSVASSPFRRVVPLPSAIPLSKKQRGRRNESESCLH